MGTTASGDCTALSEVGNGRRPYELSAMLRIIACSNGLAMQMQRRFAGLDAGIDIMPDETTILNSAPAGTTRVMRHPVCRSEADVGEKDGLAPICLR